MVVVITLHSFGLGLDLTATIPSGQRERTHSEDRRIPGT